MKKFIAVLVVLTLLLSLSATAVAKPSQRANNLSASLPEYSSYQFDYVMPEYVVSAKNTALGVNLKTTVLGLGSIDNAYIKFSATGPGNVNFTANNTTTYVNQGVLSPFDLPAQYNINTNWILNFAVQGTYQVTFQLCDAANNELAKKTQEFKVVDGHLTFTVPEKVYATGDSSIGVTFNTEQDYANVHVAFAKTAGEGDIILSSQDSDGTWYTYTNSGDLKPAPFNISGSSNKAITYKAVFTKADTYNIAFRLVAADGTVLAENSQEVAVLNPLADDEDENDEDEDKKGKGNTHGLLNAVRNHLKFKKNGKLPSKSQSLNRLMELLQERGLAQDVLDNLKDAIADLEEAISEMEKTLAANVEACDDDDFRALGKMKELKGKKYETYINGKKVKYDDAEPIVERERTLVPFRKLAEILGADVSWNQKKQEITMTKGEKNVVIMIDKNTATVDGKTVTLDVPAKLHKNRTLVPLRFLAEAFDTTVDYYPEGCLISIKNK